MSGSCIEKLPHSCGSSDGLQVFLNDGKYDGYCFACNTVVDDPYPDGEPKVKRKVRTAEDIQAEMDEVASLPVMDLPERKLKAEYLDRFGFKVGLSQADGVTPAVTYAPYTRNGKVVGYQVRLLAEKKLWSLGDIKEVDLFGWEQAAHTGAKKLFITEGQYDAAALFQALKMNAANTKWAHLDPAVVSLTKGAGSVKSDLTANFSRIRSTFKEVILAFDMDEAGKEAVSAAIQIMPDAKVAALPAKDANAALIEGRAAALARSVLFQADTPKNTRLVWGQSLYDAAREPPQWGIPWPWQGLTDLTRGIRFGETYYIGAGVKMGKSEIVNSLAAHLMINHDLKVFLAKPEESNRKTIKMVLGKVAGKFFHDPTVPFDYEAYDSAAKRVGDRLCLLSLYQHMGWNTLRSDIIAAAASGVKAVFIDPITNLVNGISAGETNTVLQEVAQELAALAKDLDIVVFIFCHLKAPSAGEPHERGGKVYSHQFSGSRAMMRSCNLMLGVEGNKDPDLPIEERNIRRIVLLEDREFGATGYINLYWDDATGLFNEMKEQNKNDSSRSFARSSVSSN